MSHETSQPLMPHEEGHTVMDIYSPAMASLRVNSCGSQMVAIVTICHTNWHRVMPAHVDEEGAKQEDQYEIRSDDIVP